MPTAFYYLLVVFLVVGLVLLVALGVTGPRRAGPEPVGYGPWWPKVLALLLVVGLFALMPRVSGALRGGLLTGDGEGVVAPADNYEAPRDESQGVSSPTLGVFLTVLFAILIAALVVGLVWLFRKDEEDLAGPSERVADPLREEVEAGIDDLTSIKDPRRAVIACYARMQGFLPTAGVASRPSDTPFEVVARVLERRNVAPGSITTLTESFERAKFSRHSIGEATRLEALAALRDIRDQLVTNS